MFFSNDKEPKDFCAPYREEISMASLITENVYAFDSTAIDLCMSVFVYVHFLSVKWSVKMHNLLDLRSSIPRFIHISDGK